MLQKGITLRGLEVFEALAASGSVAQTALLTGLSQPSVSQQLRNLESALEAELIDHSRRPMRLTAAGENFLRRARAALGELRQGTSELAVMDLTHLASLNVGVIDDFDDSLTPRLATLLADSLKGCQFRLTTASSHDLTQNLSDGRLHIAISASTGAPLEGLVEYPLARDPFIMIVPTGTTTPAEALLQGNGDLPFLRYTEDQMIARQIDAFLTRHSIAPPGRFEISSHLALMTMVARGIGWTIATPLGYMRAARHHAALSALPLPLPPVARQISLFARADWAGPVPIDIAQTMRQLIGAHMITPATESLPWLTDHLHLIEHKRLNSGH